MYDWFTFEGFHLLAATPSQYLGGSVLGHGDSTSRAKLSFHVYHGLFRKDSLLFPDEYREILKLSYNYNEYFNSLTLSNIDICDTR